MDSYIINCVCNINNSFRNFVYGIKNKGRFIKQALLLVVNKKKEGKIKRNGRTSEEDFRFNE